MHPLSTRAVRDGDAHACRGEMPPVLWDAHEHRVEAWLSNHRAGHPSEAMDAFERALVAIWSRASVSLGELTLATVVAAVLRKVKSRHSCMQGLSVAPSGIHYDRPAHDAPSDELFEALRFTLVELMRMIGRITAEILTPPLHAELARLHRSPRRLP